MEQNKKTEQMTYDECLSDQFCVCLLQEECFEKNSDRYVIFRFLSLEREQGSSRLCRVDCT